MEERMSDSWSLCRVRGDLAAAIPGGMDITVCQPFHRIRKYVRRYRAFRVVSVERWPGYAFVTGPRLHLSRLVRLSPFVSFARGDSGEVIEVSSPVLDRLLSLEHEASGPNVQPGARVHFDSHPLMENMEGVVTGFDLGSRTETAIVEVRNENGQLRTVRTGVQNLRMSA